MTNQPLFLTSNASDDDSFILNSLSRKICTSKGERKLRPKLWMVLVILLQNENQLIERKTLIDLVWNGNHFTGPQGVSHAICILRNIIKEFDLPLIIITLPKRGYILQRASITSKQPQVAEFDVIKFG